MRTLVIGPLALAIIVGATSRIVAQASGMPTPTKEHKWLQQLVGKWNTTAEAVAAPGQPPMTCSGTEIVRAIGGFWTVGEGSMNFMEIKVQSVMTLGYDPEKKKYIGTWVDSMHNHLWKYEGSLDATGKILTLDTDGPNMMSPGTTAKYKETIEIKDKDHKEMSSSMLGPDGKWITFVSVKYERQKE